MDAIAFPLSISELSFFYFDYLPSAVRASIFMHAQTVEGVYVTAVDPPIEFGELYGHGTGAAVDLSWHSEAERRSYLNVWRCIFPFCSGPPAYDPSVYPSLAISQGWPSHTKVEVTHVCCDLSTAGWPVRKERSNHGWDQLKHDAEHMILLRTLVLPRLLATGLACASSFVRLSSHSGWYCMVLSSRRNRRLARPTTHPRAAASSRLGGRIRQRRLLLLLPRRGLRLDHPLLVRRRR